MNQLPTIRFHGVEYTFDIRLNELRYFSKKEKLLCQIHLNNTQVSTLDYALGIKNIRLININMNEILNREWNE